MKICPVNNFLHSLFSQVNINISNQNVEISNTSYALRSYLENLISFNSLEKESTLLGDLFAKDDYGKFDVHTVLERSEPDETTRIVTENSVNKGICE